MTFPLSQPLDCGINNIKTEQGGQYTQQLHRLKEYEACHGNCQADGIGDDSFSDVDEGRRQQQDNKNTAFEQERQIARAAKISPHS